MEQEETGHASKSKRRKLYLRDSSIKVPRSTLHDWRQSEIKLNDIQTPTQPEELVYAPPIELELDEASTIADENEPILESGTEFPTDVSDTDICHVNSPINDLDDSYDEYDAQESEDDQTQSDNESESGETSDQDSSAECGISEDGRIDDAEQPANIRILDPHGDDPDNLRDSSGDEEDRQENNDQTNQHNTGADVLDDQPLYEGSEVTRAQMQVLLLRHIYKHHVNGEQLEDLCKIFDLLHPGAIPSSKYLFKKTLPAHLTYELHYYCGECRGYIDDTSEPQCQSCNHPFRLESAKLKEEYFISFPLREQMIDLLEQHHPKLLKKSDVLANPNYVDILSGDEVRRLMESGQITDNDFTLLWGLDGAQAFKNSSVSYWPLLVTINELTLSHRKRNMLLLGLWFGPGEKPHMETFLKPLLKEFKCLGTNGFTWNNNGVQTLSRVFLTACTCDAIAQAVIRNCNQFNGSYGCAKCYHPGEQVEKGGGSVRVYGFDGLSEASARKPKPGRRHDDPRTKDSHLTDCKKVVKKRKKAKTEKEKNVTVFGVKGPSSLMMFPMFTMVSFCGEYMHCVLLGVMKQLFSLWFDSSNHGNEWYIGTKVRRVDRAFLSIKPPNEVTRTPSSLTSRTYWKAHEYKAFLLYYGPIALKNILPGLYYSHFMMLSGALYMLLEDEVTHDSIRLAELALRKFVIKTAGLYGREYVTYNQHQLIHLADSVRMWGPLWAHSAFPFETMNNTLLKMKHGTQHTARQIADAYVCQRSIQGTANVCLEYASEKFKKLYRKLSHVGGYLACKPKMIGGIQVYGRARYATLSLFERRALARIGYDIRIGDAVETYLRFSDPRFVCHAEEYRAGIARKKRENYYVQLESGVVGTVQRIVVLAPNCGCVGACQCDSSVFVLLKKLDLEVRTSFFRDQHLGRYGFKFDHFRRALDEAGEMVASHPDCLSRKCMAIHTENETHIVYVVNARETD